MLISGDECHSPSGIASISADSKSGSGCSSSQQVPSKAKVSFEELEVRHGYSFALKRQHHWVLPSDLVPHSHQL